MNVVTQFVMKTLFFMKMTKQRKYILVFKKILITKKSFQIITFTLTISTKFKRLKLTQTKMSIKTKKSTILVVFCSIMKQIYFNHFFV